MKIKIKILAFSPGLLILHYSFSKYPVLARSFTLLLPEAFVIDYRGLLFPTPPAAPQLSLHCSELQTRDDIVVLKQWQYHLHSPAKQ